MVQRYRIAPVREGPPTLHAAISLTPRGGMPAIVSRGAPVVQASSRVDAAEQVGARWYNPSKRWEV